jgi:hypothetical protein
MPVEADWSAEIGGDLPGIEIPWDGFVDLHANASAIAAIMEATEHPALRSALVRLNASDSQTCTSKCDLWVLDEEIDGSKLDPDEFDAAAANARAGFASYIDVVSARPQVFASFAAHEQWARAIAAELCGSAVKNGRVDCVLRAATLRGQKGFAITVYAAGCGSAAPQAYAAWEAVLTAAAGALTSTHPAEGSAGRMQG